MSDKIYVAKQLHRALEFFVQTLKDESIMMEVADIYPEWTVDKNYVIDTIVKYGVNADNETQLYKVIQNHTSQANWTPDVATSLYKKVGFNPSGVPIWTQPFGTSDAYQLDDMVEHNSFIWVSVYNGANVWEPGVYGWEQVSD